MIDARIFRRINWLILSLFVCSTSSLSLSAFAAPKSAKLVIVSPKAGASYASPALITLRVKLGRQILSGKTPITFLANNRKIRVIKKKNYFQWRNVSSGSYSLLASLRNGKHNIRSSSVTIRVKSNVSGPPLTPIAGHPRLWITSADLSKLRSWATNSNPVYGVVKHLANVMAADVQAGLVPGTCVDANSDGTPDNEWDYGNNVLMGKLTDQYIHLFAFMALIEPDASQRTQYRTWAHDMIMTMVNQGKLGVYREKEECVDLGHATTDCFCRTKRRFRDMLPNNSIYYARFLTGDRGFIFDGLPLAIDWIYDSFTDQEKASIRQAFLYWMDGFISAEFNYAPRPINVINSTSLLHLDNPKLEELRYGANNHYMSYFRGVGLMSLALDDADDVGAPDARGNMLKDYLSNAIGSWLFITDFERRNDTPGGISPEGSMYADLGLKFELQFRLALASAGLANPTVWGEHVNFYDHPFWDYIVPGYLQSLPPAPVVKQSWQGPVYEAAWYGDGQQNWQTDSTGYLASVALYDQISGNSDRAKQLQWLIRNTFPGGSDKFLDRIDSSFSNTKIRDAILSYLVFDPNDSLGADPRTSLPLEFYDPGLGRILARTSWDAAASYFTYKLGFNRIDHNHGDANMFEFFRKGQWLTKNWVGYGARVSLSDYNNTLTVKNYCSSGDGSYNSGGYNFTDWQNGSQMRLGAGTQAAYNAHSASDWMNSPMDPRVKAKSLGAGQPYLAVTGDSTILYNHYNQYNPAETCEDVQHVSRSIVWLKPDHIVVYDRAKTGHSGFKRFWLNLPSQPAIVSGASSVVSQSSSLNSQQKISISTVLPQPNQVSVTSTSSRPITDNHDETATGEDFAWRIKIEASGDPAQTRFLNVIQGLDAADSPDTVTYIHSSSGTSFDGASVNHKVVMFKNDLSAAFTSLTYTAPSGTTSNIITGLTPGGAYTASIQNNVVTISAGGALSADEGGVLIVE